MDFTGNVEDGLSSLPSPTPSLTELIESSDFHEIMNIIEAIDSTAPEDFNPFCNKREASENSDSLMAEVSHQQPKKLRRTLSLINLSEFTVPITNNSFICFNPDKKKLYVKLKTEFPVEFSLDKGAVDLNNLVVRATLVLASNQHKVLRRCLTHSCQVDPTRGVLEAGADEKNVRYELDEFERPTIIVPVVDKSDLESMKTLIRVNYVFKCWNSCFKQHIKNLLDNKTKIIFTLEKLLENESIVYGRYCLMSECTEKPKRSFKTESKTTMNEAKASSSRSSHLTRATSAVSSALLTPPQTSDDDCKSSSNQFRTAALPHQVLQEKLLSIPSDKEPLRQMYEKCIEFAKSLEAESPSPSMTFNDSGVHKP